MPEDEGDSRDHLLQWFGNEIRQSGVFDLKETLYFPESLGMIKFFLERINTYVLFKLII